MYIYISYRHAFWDQIMEIMHELVTIEKKILLNIKLRGKKKENISQSNIIPIYLFHILLLCNY